MTRGRLLAFGAGVYVLALLALAPASLIDAALRDASAGRLRVAEAQGSLWSGRGEIEVRDGRGDSALSRPLSWRLRPAALMLARLGFVVTLDGSSAPFPLTLSWSRAEVTDARFSLPASALANALPKLGPFGLGGDVDVQISRVAITGDVVRGGASVQWRGASSALTPVAPLGDYQFRFDGDDGDVHTSLRTLHGPLQLDGHGDWAQGGRPQFLAVAQMSPAARQQLAPFLRLVAVERADGSFEWRLK